MTTVRRRRSSRRMLKHQMQRRVEDKNDMMDRFHSDRQVCFIPATSPDVEVEKRLMVFDKFRPEPGTCIDYEISQTDIKMDAKYTKIHLQQTRGEYLSPPPGTELLPPPPSPPQPAHGKNKYFSGGPPCWEFVDEQWRRQVEELQKIYRKELKKMRAARLRYNRNKFNGFHKLLEYGYAGPIWFQELSTKQMNTVDNLRTCIAKDIKEKTLINTKENLGELGLVLRPNDCHIDRAMKNCCSCPVEFLLVLYQLLNPKRTEYSMNDKLILSSVVHLAMRDTLKEMHIRMPSPPPKPAPKRKPPKPKKKRKTYKSPYLVPFTFKPQPRKHTGIYKNTKRQYPQSIYFSYIKDLRLAKEEAELRHEEALEKRRSADTKKAIAASKRLSSKMTSPTSIAAVRRRSSKAASSGMMLGVLTSSEQLELDQELEEAQAVYDLMGEGPARAPRLQRPSIYVPCSTRYRMTKDQLKAHRLKKQVTNAELKIQVKVTTDYDQNDKPVDTRCKCTIIFEETAGVDSELFEDGGGAPQNQQQLNDKNEADQDGVRGQLERVLGETGYDDDATGGVCVCASEPHLLAEDAKPLPLPPPRPPSQEQALKPAEEVKKMTTAGGAAHDDCCCKEEMQKRIETAVCQCERCKEDRRLAMGPTRIISGVRMDEEGPEPAAAVQVLEGVKEPPTCDCLEKYLEKVRRFEAFQARFNAQQLLKSDGQHYVMGGVCTDEDGTPRYIISGVMPPTECLCKDIVATEREDELRRLKNMPKIPGGRLKYVISGVKETPQGNVYQVSGVVPIDDCECMKLYEKFVEKHAPCMEALEEYMEQAKNEIEAYIREIQADERYRVPLTEVESDGNDVDGENGEKEEEEYVESEGGQDKEASDLPRSFGDENDAEEAAAAPAYLEERPVEAERAMMPVTQVVTTQQPAPAAGDEMGSAWQPRDEEVETNLYITLEVNKKDSKLKVTETAKKKADDIDIESLLPGMGGKKRKESGEDSAVHLKRFTLLKELPTDPKAQVKLVKKVLNSMADDNFPLAKLPFVYKLPHFELWMKWRCGKYWTAEERAETYMKLSKALWNHIDGCQRVSEVAQFDFPLSVGDKYTWANANLVRRMVREKLDSFYRDTKKCSLDDGREFFPTLFHYEFPNKHFRDTFFAYIPCKEEEIFAYRPWMAHEVKDFSARKSCL